jgi:hypothetical protein
MLALTRRQDAGVPAFDASHSGGISALPFHALLNSQSSGRAQSPAFTGLFSMYLTVLLK